jgi:hypothetical protein
LSNVTGATTLTGANIFSYNIGSPGYLLLTSGGAVSLTDELTTLLLASTVDGDTQIGISEDSTTNAAQVVIDKPAGTATNTFQVQATGAGATAIGFKAASALSLSTVTINGTDATHANGLFDVFASQTAVGAQMGRGAFTNNGFLEVDSQNNATGVIVAGTGSVTNTFQMHVQALTGVGVSFTNASGASFTNSGANSILQVDDLTGGSGVGIAFGGAYAAGQWLTITNAGDLHADTAIQALTSGVSSTPIVHLTNTGTIEGDIHLGIGPSALHGAGSQVINNGQITGNVYLDTNGDDLYDSSAAGGRASAVYLGSGSDTVHLGSAGGVVHGGGGSAVITGSSGAITTYSGSGAETITGSSAADAFGFGPGLGADVVTNYSAAQGDKIDLYGFGAVQNFSQVLADASQVGSDTVITLGAGSVKLQGVAMSSLTASDFLFVSSPTTVTGTSANHFTATFDGVLRQYTVGADGSSVIGGPEGANDTLVNIQRLQFVDGYLSVSTTDTAGQVYRLYEATLDRAPDQDGLVYWVDMLNSGTTLQNVASGFVNSQEFQFTYGALSNSDFVNLIYENVLHRAADSGGLSYWTNVLDTGQASRAQVVTGFSESAEDIADLAAPVQHGLWIGNAPAAEVARLYDSVFGRLPDASGEAYWTGVLEAGASLQNVANGFVGSVEFQSTYGALNNTDFVTTIYENVLHRAPDSGGLSYWTNLLNTGQGTRAQVVADFSESAEHVSNTAAHIEFGVWVA